MPSRGMGYRYEFLPVSPYGKGYVAIRHEHVSCGGTTIPESISESTTESKPATQNLQTQSTPTTSEKIDE